MEGEVVLDDVIAARVLEVGEIGGDEPRLVGNEFGLVVDGVLGEPVTGEDIVEGEIVEALENV